MTSKHQIESNRKNSFKSTGPITREGKEIVSQNPIRHGILSTKVAVDAREIEEYTSFFNYLHEMLMPEDALQSLLVDRIISIAWRLRRIVQVESSMFKEIARFDYRNSGYQQIFFGNSGQAMSLLSRYERTLENSLFRNLKQLSNLQNREIVIPIEKKV